MVLALITALALTAEPPTAFDFSEDSVDVTATEIEAARHRAEGTVKVARTLTREEIRKTVREVLLSGLRECYARALGKNEGLAGKVVLHFTIEPSGQIKQAKLKDSAIADKAFTGCAVGAMKATPFPRTDGKTTVSYPVVFRYLH